MNLYPFINGAIPWFLELKSHDERALSLPYWKWNYIPSAINWDHVPVSRVLRTWYFWGEFLKKLYSPHLASLAWERLQLIAIVFFWFRELESCQTEEKGCSGPRKNLYKHQSVKVVRFILLFKVNTNGLYFLIDLFIYILNNWFLGFLDH